ncbi:ANTAR domain-containing protein [Lentzea sp. DG1S-22]|nr:ANTAR domain-containing protein [Lentzea sp. DG1S-22]WVH84892.1 ANTAR domain-containing protein [Lentzea sp. DG1S-22]
MAAHTITADEAFRLLVQQSQRENVKLHTPAERFIADITGRTTPPEPRSREGE